MNQTTNIRRILDRVMRHPMMRDIPFETAVEYAVDFIQLMGTPALYDELNALLKTNQVVLVEKETTGPLKKVCFYSNQIAALALQEEQYV